MTSSSSDDAPQDNTIQSDDSNSAARPKKTGIVIVGCGQIMTHHVEQIAGTGEPLHIIALCDPNPKRRQVLLECGRHYGVLSDSVREYNTLTEFLSHDNDPTQVPQSSNPSSDSTSTTTTTTQHIIAIALPHDLHGTRRPGSLGKWSSCCVGETIGTDTRQLSCDSKGSCRRPRPGCFVVVARNAHCSRTITVLGRNCLGPTVDPTG
jgi:hypothetical protein